MRAKKIVIAVARKLAIINIVNFVAFACGSLWLGGDAILGKIEGDRYFVGEHGTYTEVPEWLYLYSAWHLRSLVVTFPLGIASGLILWLVKDFSTPRAPVVDCKTDGTDGLDRSTTLIS